MAVARERVGRDLGITEFTRVFGEAEGAVEFSPKVGRTLNPQQGKILFHGNGDRPAHTAGMAAVRTFADKIAVIVGHRIYT